MKTFAVVNPKSANGTTGKEWPQMKAAIEAALGEIDFGMTTRAFEAAEITRKALKEGYERIISIGGDGTINEVVNGFFEIPTSLEPPTPVNSEAVLAIVSRGTGCDYIKTLEYPKELAPALERLKAGKTRTVDLGLMKCTGLDGKPVYRMFDNIADFGLGGETAVAVNNTTKRFGGFLSFLWGSIKAIVLFKNKKVRVSIDDEPETEMLVNNFNMCIGKYYGGGMFISPNSELDDGKFTLVVYGGVNKLEFILKSSRIYSGRHLLLPYVTERLAEKVTADSDMDVFIDFDGEMPGKLPATFKIVPAALKVCV